LIDAKWRFQGFADHNVSEALYLPDPDGNGLEIYRDRPRSEWRYDGDQIYMSSDPIDADGILALADNDSNPYDNIHPETIIGHVHLHVSELDPSETFYVDTIGLDMMLKWREAGAYFLSVGGYHHHLGMNIWAGQGVPPPPDNAVGLKSFGLWIENQDDYEGYIAHLDSLSVPSTAVEYPYAKGIQLHDPSQNVVEVLTSR
jgi:catechol 2,3-dioxygenase